MHPAAESTRGALPAALNKPAELREVRLALDLARVGVCGGGLSKINAHHFGCSTARNKGTCINLLTIRRDVLEAMVLDALRHRLMDPELFRVFVAEFTAE